MQQAMTETRTERILQLVELDIAVVTRTLGEGKPAVALQKAQEAFEKRRPLVEWLLQYRFDKARLVALEKALDCTLIRQIAPNAASDLNYERTQLLATLKVQRSRLSRALLALEPDLRQRLLTAARDQPRLIPSISKRVAGSTAAWGQWRVTKWLLRKRWISQERIEAMRARLIERWLQVRASGSHRSRPSPRAAFFGRGRGGARAGWPRRARAL